GQALTGPLHFPELSVDEACRRTTNRDSQANGALMRVAPIGIAAHGSPHLAADWAQQDALLTHPHPVCQEVNDALAAAIAVGVAGGSRADMLETALGMAADEGEGAESGRAHV